MPISPLEAANLVNEQVTVEMLVKAAKNCQHCFQVFLDSEEDHHDPNNLAVAITKAGKARFKGERIGDLALHFKGKIIRVTGVVTLKENRRQIEVDAPGQIEVVEK
jgi:DNA/RNA endonuclease YhcR with UshA esterase domain